MARYVTQHLITHSNGMVSAETWQDKREYYEMIDAIVSAEIDRIEAPEACIRVIKIIETN